jgi:hypothetical protein
MTHEPIAERLEHDWDAFKNHLHHHSATMQPAITRTPPEAAMSLITTIEDDIKAAGHEVDQVIHDVLAKHLGLANIAAHVAQGLATAQGDPLVQLGESLLPGGAAVIAKFVTDITGFLGAAVAPAEVAAEPVPAPVA